MEGRKPRGRPAQRYLAADLIGSAHGAFTILSEASRDQRSRRYFVCRCSCGVERTIRLSVITSGKRLACHSCAPLVHGQASGGGMTREYQTWAAMKERCGNPSSKNFARYGARGITVSVAWRERFEAFFADMGPRPLGHTLERIDNNGPYSADNCRWATPREQAQNRRTNVRLTHDGETLTIQQWADRLHWPRSRIEKRIKAGWTVAKTLTLEGPK